MARQFYTPISLNGLEIQNVKFQNLASAPTPKGVGHVYYNTANTTLYVYDGATWQPTGKVVAGLFAARPAAGSPGLLFFATDRNLMYYDNGSAWSQVSTFGSPSGLSNPASAGAAASEVDGTAYTFARSDHQHSHDSSDHANIKHSDLAAPTAATSWGSQKITNLADPTSAQDAATKSYVDATAQGLDVKGSVRAATTVTGTLATSFANASVIDGVALATGDRILIKNQATGSENGIYTVNATGAPTRAIDADVNADITAGLFTFVAEGTINADTGWVLTTNDAITVGTTALTFTQFSGAGTYTSSNGVLLTGTNFTFAPSTAGGLTTGSGGGAILLDTNAAIATTSSGTKVKPGLGITTSAAGAAGAATTDTVAINTDVVVRKFAVTIGDTVATAFTATHNLNTRDVSVTIMDNATYEEVFADVVHTTVNTVTITFAAAPALNAYRIIIHA